MKINRNSWHYKWASAVSERVQYYDPARSHYRLDFCTYLRAVLKALFLVALIYTVLSVFAWCFVDLALWIAVGIQYGFSEPGAGAMFATIALVFAAVGGIAYGIMRLVANRQLVPEPVREAYGAWKDKYCPMIDVEGQ